MARRWRSNLLPIKAWVMTVTALGTLDAMLMYDSNSICRLVSPERARAGNCKFSRQKKPQCPSFVEAHLVRDLNWFFSGQIYAHKVVMSAKLWQVCTRVCSLDI